MMLKPTLSALIRLLTCTGCSEPSWLVVLLMALFYGDIYILLSYVCISIKPVITKLTSLYMYVKEAIKISQFIHVMTLDRGIYLLSEHHL